LVIFGLGIRFGGWGDLEWANGRENRIMPQKIGHVAPQLPLTKSDFLSINNLSKWGKLGTWYAGSVQKACS